MGRGMAEEAWMNRLPRNPTTLRMNIMVELESLVLLEIQLPMLENRAEETLANRPISAIYLFSSPCPVRKMLNMPP